VTPEIATDPGFAFVGIDQFNNGQAAAAAQPRAVAASVGGPQASPMGALGDLVGLWKGHGFNTIWRPHHTGQDRFLELNRTDETLLVTAINGPIPNRGLANPDINMFGATYLQQISESSTGQGLHIEPGIWASVPQTSDPNIPATVVRMGSIPHGTAILAQGDGPQVIQGGPPNIPNNNIFPIFFGQPPFPDLASAAANFPELQLSTPSQFRFVAPGVTQAMVTNPNSVLQQALTASLQGTHMKSRTFIRISTTQNPVPAGGGTANTAFLASSNNPAGGNAKATHVEATFWIQTIAGTGGQPDKHQLQYTQLVMLDFNQIHWPHVTVGTLIKQ
jgi:hypothetical protein